MSINHRVELQGLETPLLENIAHQCRGALITARGRAIRYHQERGTMARNIINERQVNALKKTEKASLEKEAQELQQIIEGLQTQLQETI